jgi:hypothetical protein
MISLIMVFLPLIHPYAVFGEATGYDLVYPSPESEDDYRDTDALEVLRTALERTRESHGPYSLTQGDVMNVERSKYGLLTSERVNIIWTSPSREMDERTIPVRIPIRKGILGYRVFLIRKEDREKFASIHKLEDLKKLSLGQGLGWEDVRVLEDGGFSLVIGSDYEGLFQMLNAGRFDYFSRGINEAPIECRERSGRLRNLWIEESLLLYYPWPKFFYVSQKSPHVAQRIERGLEIMIEDGSYDEIFHRYNDKNIRELNLRNRRLFRIENPLLPPGVPLDREELWFDPFAD